MLTISIFSFINNNLPFRDKLNYFAPLPNDKILDLAKLKAFADHKLTLAKMTVSVFDSLEKTVGKRENAG